MGKRGPKKTPQVLQDLKGNPEHRPRLPDAVEATGKPIMPLWLDVDAMIIFNRVVDAMPPDFYSSADAEILASYATACSTAKAAALEVQDRGVVIEEDKTDKDGNIVGYVLKKNPAQSVWAESVSRIATLGTRLGLDPAARQAIGMPADPGKQNHNNGFGDLIGNGAKPKLTSIPGGKT